MYTFIGRLSANISVDYWSTIGQQLTNYQSIVERYIDRLSADASADMCTFIGRLLADILVHCWLIYRLTIDR